MTRRQDNTASKASVKVCGFRLDEESQQKLQELAERFSTTPSKYARGIVTSHLQGKESVESSAHNFDELGAYLHQVRDELLLATDRGHKRLEALASHLHALTTHINALTKRVSEIDARLATFLSQVQPM